MYNEGCMHVLLGEWDMESVWTGHGELPGSL